MREARRCRLAASVLKYDSDLDIHRNISVVHQELVI